MKKIIPVVLFAASLYGCNSDSSVNNFDESTPGKKCEIFMTGNDIEILPRYYQDRDTELEYGYPIEYPTKALRYAFKLNSNEIKITDKAEWRYTDITGKTIVVPLTNIETEHIFPMHDLYHVSLYVNDAYCGSKDIDVQQVKHKPHPPTYVINGQDLEFCIADGNILDKNTVVKLKHTGYVGKDKNNRLDVTLNKDKDIRQKCTIIPKFRKYIHVALIEGSDDYTKKSYGLYYNLDSTIEEYGYNVLTSGSINFKESDNVQP